MMKKSKWLLLLAVLCAAAYAGYYYGAHHPGEKADQGGAGDESSGDEAAKKAVAQVETAPVRKGEISEEIKAYGSVSAQEDKVRTVSLAFESRVMRVLVSSGEPVTKGAPIAEIEPSPETQLLLDEAKNDAAATAKELQQTRERFQSKLATNQELGTAEQAARSAEDKLRSLQQRGVEGRKTLAAESDGIVGEVKAQVGQIVPAGAPIMDVIGGNQIEVKLGVEPGDVANLAAGQPVKLWSVHDSDAPPAEGKIRLVTQRVNPDVRTVEVFVSLPDDSHFLLNEYVSALVTVKSAKDALLVPRAAVLPGDEGWTLFIVKDKHAVKKNVKKGLETDSEVEITDSDLHEGDPVVLSGNYELEDGMSVDIK